MFETFAVMGTALGLLGTGLAITAWLKALQGDPKGIRADFRRLDGEWSSAYERLMALEKRLSKRESRAEARGNHEGRADVAGNLSALSDGELYALARQRGAL